MSGDMYMGVRFPPSWIALLADIVTEECPPPARTPGEHPAQEVTAPHPVQVFSVWVRFGVIHDPTIEEITAFWSVLGVPLECR